MAEPVITTPHNQTVGSEELSTVFLNYLWRRLIAEQIAPMAFRSFWTGSESDIDISVNNACDLLRDLYDTEVFGMNKVLRLGIAGDYSMGVDVWEALQIEQSQSTPQSFNGLNVNITPLLGKVEIDNEPQAFYRVAMAITGSTGTLSRDRCRILKNGVDVIAQSEALCEVNTMVTAHGSVFLEPSEYLIFEHRSEQGRTLKQTRNSGRATFIDMWRMFPM